MTRGAVFLCYNSRDRSQVIAIAEALKAAGGDVWIDDWQAGTTMQALADAVQSSASSIDGAVIFIGESGLGGWQGFEARLFARAHFERGLPIVVALVPPLRARRPTFRGCSRPCHESISGAIRGIRVSR